MTILILGLILFLGIHSVRIFTESTRTRFIEKKGAKTWKNLYSLVSALGLFCIIWGFSVAREMPVIIGSHWMSTHEVSAVLTLLAFILMVATYIPGNGLKARLHHPMTLSLMLWAGAHLLVTYKLANLILFSSFFVWAFLSFCAARKRDTIANITYPSGRIIPTAITIIAGFLAWGLFSGWVHFAWLGVKPLI